MSGVSAVKISTMYPLDEEQLQEKLKHLTKEIVSDLSKIDSARSKEILNDFVSELLLTAAEQKRREERRRKQSERIAAAKAKGVRFGRPETPLPDNFDDIHQAWRGGQLTLSQAAESCGMPVATFYAKSVRIEQAPGCNT